MHGGQLFLRAREGPVSKVCGGRLANDDAQNMICLTNAICAEATSMTSHLLSVLAQVAGLNHTIFGASSFAVQPP